MSVQWQASRQINKLQLNYLLRLWLVRRKYKVKWWKLYVKCFSCLVEMYNIVSFCILTKHKKHFIYHFHHFKLYFLLTNQSKIFLYVEIPRYQRSKLKNIIRNLMQNKNMMSSKKQNSNFKQHYTISFFFSFFKKVKFN